MLLHTSSVPKNRVNTRDNTESTLMEDPSSALIFYLFIYLLLTSLLFTRSPEITTQSQHPANKSSSRAQIFKK